MPQSNYQPSIADVVQIAYLRGDPHEFLREHMVECYMLARTWGMTPGAACQISIEVCHKVMVEAHEKGYEITVDACKRTMAGIWS